MPDKIAAAVRELVEAKLEQRAPEIVLALESKSKTAVIDIICSQREHAGEGRAKVRDAVRKRMGKAAPKEQAARRAHEVRWPTA
jgi:hypothetical protein